MAWPIAAATQTSHIVCVTKWHSTMAVHRRPEPAGVDSDICACYAPSGSMLMSIPTSGPARSSRPVPALRQRVSDAVRGHCSGLGNTRRWCAGRGRATLSADTHQSRDGRSPVRALPRTLSQRSRVSAYWQAGNASNKVTVWCSSSVDRNLQRMPDKLRIGIAWPQSPGPPDRWHRNLLGSEHCVCHCLHGARAWWLLGQLRQSICHHAVRSPNLWGTNRWRYGVARCKSPARRAFCLVTRPAQHISAGQSVLPLILPNARRTHAPLSHW